LQQATIIVVRDKDARAKVEALVPSMPWMSQASELLVFCGDNARIRRIAELRGKPFPNDTLDMFMNAAVDAGLVMQGFITAAESIGLGCCPISVLRDEVEQLSDILGLPAGVFPVAGLCVGYPAREARFSMRLPPAATVHTDRYDTGALDRELAAYDARRAEAEPAPPGRQRHADKYADVLPYTWSEDKARQYCVPQRHTFGDYIRKQGFALK
jgi:nitroreductase/FMN reductase [NAD(P)H]